MQASGLDPRGMASFFDRMGKFNRLYDNNAPVYLRTHPLTTDRLADIQNRLPGGPSKQKPTPPAQPRIETPAAGLKRAQGQESAALAIYRAALKRFPFHRALIYDYADTLLQAKQGAEAVKFVNEQLKTRANDYRLYEYQARGYAALQKRFHSHRALAEAYARRGNLTAAIEQLQI